MRASAPKITLIEIIKIVTSTIQPRTKFDDDKVAELAQSIAAHGILQPLIVRNSDKTLYEIVAGERRYRAAKIVGLTKIPCIVMNVMNDKALAIALVENIQRQDLNPIEEAQAYSRLKETMGLSQEEVAARVGKDRASVANTIRLLKLPQIVQSLVVGGEISMGHARALLALESQEMMAMVAKKIIRDNMSVRKTEALIRSLKSGHTTSDGLRSKAMSDEELIIQRDIQKKLEEALGTRVALKRENSGYAIVVHFATVNQLNGILEVLGVEI